jgi:hypothetical protein
LNGSQAGSIANCHWVQRRDRSVGPSKRKQQEATDGGWGRRDIPPGSYDEANVVTAGPGNMLFERRQQYKSDPVIAEHGTYRLTLMVHAVKGGADTLRLGIDWNGTRGASVWNADEPSAQRHPAEAGSAASTRRAAQGFP